MEDELCRLVQEYMSKNPVIVLGSGASVPHGIPGMGLLGEHLQNSILPLSCEDDKHKECWQEFLERLKIEDLESALTNISATDEVTDHIVSTTWAFLNSEDLNIYHQVIRDRRFLPLSRLFRYMFGSVNREIHVVTPNYDRLAEYAAEAAGYATYTGFSFGYLGERTVTIPPKITLNGRPHRTVNVWKVHGSFGWFRDPAGVVVSLPPMLEPPSGLLPVIVTPGIEKYRITHDEPFRSAMHNADAATQNASAFLCIGYGFNDRHLQSRLIERCQRDDVPLILITKEISSTAHAFFKSGKCRKYIAIEEATQGIKIYSNKYPNGNEIKNVLAYWQLENFLKLIQ
ncbi:MULTISPECIES: SIR2 family protein [Acinetobacter]|nr:MULTISPECIES: SIR2 family protein [Acinetobacter]